MTKRVRKIILRAACFSVAFAVLISVPVMIAHGKGGNKEEESGFEVLTLWQVDGFEGGKGSRYGYLQNIADEFEKIYGQYVNVKSLTPSATRENIALGNLPDMISYGAGMYGIEGIICGNAAYYTWAHGGYCFLTLDESADFLDISAENTILNVGTYNLAQTAALFCGLENCMQEKPTGAYVKLLEGEYKYLLGTQRDIYRLKTRGASFKVKAVKEFNDLYQNISITTNNSQKAENCQKFIGFLQSKSQNLVKLGLMGDAKLYDDEMSALEGVEYGYKLTSPVSKSAYDEIVNATRKSDINLLKKLLK